jgi:hypothetical protein
MSQGNTQQKAVAEPVPTPAPVITPYQQVVAQLTKPINETAAQIPGYNDDLSGNRKVVRRPVSANFLGLTVAAIEASSELQGANQLDTTECRDTLQFGEAIQPLKDLFVGTARRLDLLQRTKEAKVGRGALATYNIAKRIAKNPNNTQLVPHVETLKAELRRTRIGRQVKSPVPTTPIPAPKGGATT